MPSDRRAISIPVDAVDGPADPFPPADIARYIMQPMVVSTASAFSRCLPSSAS
jgi:hypothetical protein